MGQAPGRRFTGELTITGSDGVSAVVGMATLEIGEPSVVDLIREYAGPAREAIAAAGLTPWDALRGWRLPWELRYAPTARQRNQARKRRRGWR